MKKKKSKRKLIITMYLGGQTQGQCKYIYQFNGSILHQYLYYSINVIIYSKQQGYIYFIQKLFLQLT